MIRIFKPETNERYTAYIYNNITNKKIPFISMPQNISESISATFTQQAIVGASVPRVVYSNTSAKTMGLSLQNVTEDYLPQGYSSLREYTKAFQALVYPTYSASGIVTSPNMTLVLGDRSMKCVCTNVNITWGSLVREQQIISCNIDLQLLMTRPSVPGATDVELIG